MYKSPHTLWSLAFSFVVTVSSLAHAETLKLSGDIRYRHDQARVDGSPDRFRDRLRARLALEAEIEENWKGFLRLATGESASASAVSANQTLTGAGEGKAVWVNWAYLQWEATPEMKLRLGKMANMWWQPAGQQFVFDEDYAPEGFSGQWTNADGVFLNAHAHWLVERFNLASPSDETDAGFVGLQGGIKKTMSNGAPVTGALGVYQISNLRGRPLLTRGSSGNSTRVTGATIVYDKNYSIAVLSGEYECTQKPLKFGLQLARNLAIGKRNGGVQATAQWGQIKVKGDWQAAYSFRYTERDALFGALSEDDVAGPMDSRGQIFQA